MNYVKLEIAQYVSFGVFHTKYLIIPSVQRSVALPHIILLYVLCSSQLSLHIRINFTIYFRILKFYMNNYAEQINIFPLCHAGRPSGPQTFLLYWGSSPPGAPALNFFKHTTISHRIWIIYDHIRSICDHLRTIYGHIWIIYNHIWSIYDYILSIWSYIYA